MGVMQPSNPYLSQPPRSPSDTHYCVVGDVTVDAAAVIAPGVVLQAPTGSRIIIEKGACLAGGVCIQSRQGVLKIGASASLGANVLIIGHGTVGANACISPSSTVIDPQIEQSAIIAPCSLIANPAANESAANAVEPPADEFKNTFVEPPPIGPRPIETPDLSDQNGQYQESLATQYGYSSFTNDVQLNNSPSSDSNSGSGSGSGLAQNGSSSLAVQSNGCVYGREQVSQLLSTLFPNRQSS